jgi:hypothetical protein
MSISNYREIDRIQKAYFSLLDEFFIRATGRKYSEFCAISDFAATIKASAHLAPRMREAFIWADKALRDFYAGPGKDLFTLARAVGGQKLVMGGGSRFGETHFDSVRKMALYADTILIADPVLPWLEIPREEERFGHVLFIQAIFVLLHLKPLVDADLPYPPIVIFPSWEKLLERHDPQTREGQKGFAAATIAFHIKKDFANLEKLAQYAVEHTGEFFAAVEGAQLLVAQDCQPDMPLNEQVAQYRRWIKTWRSEAHLRQTVDLPDSLFVLSCILERLAPQYHILENADELCAQPMFCLPQHWHYYKLCTNHLEGRLRSADVINAESIAAIRAMNEPNLQWLGNVPIESLVELRRNNENEEFRRRLNAYTKTLGEASLCDLNRVSGEVARGIAALIAEHQRTVREIRAKYSRSYSVTAVASWISVAATLVPALAPLGGMSAVTLAFRYGKEKMEELAAKNSAAKSLMGVLALADSSTAKDS